MKLGLTLTIAGAVMVYLGIVDVTFKEVADGFFSGNLILSGSLTPTRG